MHMHMLADKLATRPEADRTKAAQVSAFAQNVTETALQLKNLLATAQKLSEAVRVLSPHR